MSKLKDIDLKDLGIKNKNIEGILTDSFAEKSVFSERSEMALEDAEYSSPSFSKRKSRSPYTLYSENEKIINNSPNMNNKFLKYVNIIENIKDKPGRYFDKRAEWEKDLEPAEFTIPSKPIEKIIPLTFRKFFYQVFSKNITKFALEKPEQLPGLIAGIKNIIQKDAWNWLDFVADKQVSGLLCQIDNYSQKGKVYKKSDEFQNIPQVIQWIIDTNLKTLYESADWNKDREKTFSEERGNLLIIDSWLFQRIEIAEQQENNQEKEKRKIPLPLHWVWNQFATVINFPLKNNFQFIIIDKRALIGWQDFQKLEIKYDEANSTTYFCRKMEGGFKQLTYYNASAFVYE